MATDFAAQIRTLSESGDQSTCIAILKWHDEAVARESKYNRRKKNLPGPIGYGDNAGLATLSEDSKVHAARVEVTRPNL
jgi:hypothetical protein